MPREPSSKHEEIGIAHGITICKMKRPFSFNKLESRGFTGHEEFRGHGVNPQDQHPTSNGIILGPLEVIFAMVQALSNILGFWFSLRILVSQLPVVKKFFSHR